MVDFEWYRSFVAVYQTGTVSAAARRRLMTQPGISQHIMALEASLGTSLFQRTPRQMMPTADGQQLYTQVVGAVEQLDRLSDPARIKAETQPLRLWIGVAREFFYADVLPRFARANQGDYFLQVTVGQTNTLIKQVEARELDLVIATQRISRRAVHYVSLQTEQFILVAPPSLRLPDGLTGDKVMDWLEQQSWIAYAPDLPIIRRYWQEVFERRPNIVPRLVMPDLLMILRAVMLGLGVSVLPEYLCRDAIANGELRLLWQPAAHPTNQLYAACLRERLHTAEIVWMLGILTLE